MTSQENTDTDGRLKKLLQTTVGEQLAKSTDKKITQAIDDASIKTAIVTKFYPYLDQAEVQLNNNKKVLCRLSHRFMGSIIDFYTPDGDRSFCNTIKEPCIIPRDTLNCFVAPVDDDIEYVLLSYFTKDDLLGFSPPGSGCMKIFNFRATNEDYIEFCGDGLKIMARKPIESKYGEYSDDITEVQYSDEIGNVYDKNETYSRDEIDEKINNINCGSNINIDGVDVDFNLNFGVSGRDDIITVETFLKQE